MAPNDRVTTPRLRLRKPVREDAQAIFPNLDSDQAQDVLLYSSILRTI